MKPVFLGFGLQLGASKLLQPRGVLGIARSVTPRRQQDARQSPTAAAKIAAPISQQRLLCGGALLLACAILAWREGQTIDKAAMADPEINVVALTKTYFEVWNSHDEAALRGLHADASSLHDWDATHGPTNAAVAAGVAGIWKAEPTIKCEIIDLYTCGPDLTVVANINVVVNAEVTIKVCDVIEFDASGRVTSLNAFLKKD